MNGPVGVGRRRERDEGVGGDGDHKYVRLYIGGKEAVTRRSWRAPLTRLRAVRSADAGANEAVGGDGRLLAPECEVPASSGLDTRREREPGQQRAGSDEVEAAPLRVLLEARSGVEDVADEDDLLSQVAQLTGRDRAAVDSAPEARHHFKVTLVAGRVARHDRVDPEEAVDAVGPAQAGLERPRDHDLVARVLVDLPFRLEHRLRQIVHEAAEQLEVAGAAQPLRQLGRTLEIQKEEDALLRLRAVVR